MKLTPLDIRKQEFSRKFRGCDPEEVQMFLNMVAAQWESVLEERQGLENRLTELRAKLEHYEKVEVALEEALRITRESSEKTIRNAEDKARNLIENAESQARRREDEGRKTVNEIRRQAARLNDYRLELMARLRALLTSETELLARYEEHANVVLARLYAGAEGESKGQRPVDTAPPAAPAPRKPKEPRPASLLPAEEETDAETDTKKQTEDTEAAPDAKDDAPPMDPAPKKPKNTEKVSGEPDSSSDIQHIRRILKDLD